MDSILQTSKECYITGATTQLHRHHCYGGGRRKISEENGFWIWLRADYHNMSNHGVHFDHQLDLLIKQDCQRKYEETHTREDFIRLIGKNYLED